MVRKTGGPSPEQTAKINRQRIASYAGARALDEVAKQALAVRKNMARLRELRLAKEAEKQSRPEAKQKGSPEFMAETITCLVRVTTDDRAHQLWVASAFSDEEALTMVLEAIPEGWTAALLANKLKPFEIEVLNLKQGEVWEISSIAGSSAAFPPPTH
jgi:hypothetical protein